MANDSSGRASPPPGQAVPDPSEDLSDAGKQWLENYSEEKKERAYRNMSGTPANSWAPIGSIVAELVKQSAAPARKGEQGEQAAPPKPAAQVSSDPYGDLLRLSQGPKPRKEAHARIPRELMSTPQYNRLNAIAHRTLGGLFLSCNKRTLTSWPKHTNLLKRLGMPDTASNRKQIQRGIAELKRRGVIWQKSGAYPGRAAEYFLARNQRHIDFILSLNGGQGTSPKLEDGERPPLGENP